MRASLVYGVGVTALLAMGNVTVADDEKAEKSDKSASLKSSSVEKSKAPDFSAYTFVTTVTGEVVKSSDKSLTIRVFWAVPKVNNTNNRRPNLYSGRGHYNPYMTRNRQSVSVKWEHHDYEIPYIDESLVRTKHLPELLDVDGKKKTYSEKERDALKVPYSVPGYQAAKSDLTPGTVIELSVVRDKNVPKATVTEADMRVKYAIIVGHDSNPANYATSGGNKK